MSIIRTSRLQLREFDFGDAEFILQLLNEEGFIHHIGDKGVRTLADACDYIAQGPMMSYERFGFGLYATCLDGVPIGMCGLVKRDELADPDVGFAFLHKHCSKGYALESASAVLTYGAEALKLRRIVAITTPQNLRSIGVLEKIGLKFERLVRLNEQGPELKLFGPAPSENHT
jgi:RimJ/RimL family protein N-acetyltransferase